MVVKRWNGLLREVVKSPSRDLVKGRLGRHLAGIVQSRMILPWAGAELDDLIKLLPTLLSSDISLSVPQFPTTKCRVELLLRLHRALRS